MPQITALLLAAGRSRRMGVCKQLLPLPDRPAVLRCVQTLRAAGVGRIIVVTGPDGGVSEALAGEPVTLAVNEAPDSDMAGSVRTGLWAIDGVCRGVLVCLCDHPLVRAETITSLIRHFDHRPDRIVIPLHKGRKGHPTLFPRPLLEEMEHLPTLRHLLSLHHDTIELLPVEDEGVLLDMDTPEEYRRILTRLGSAGASEGEPGRMA